MPVWLPYDEKLIPSFKNEVKKDIANLCKMQLKSDYIYVDPKGVKRVVTMWGFPQGTFIPTGPYKSERQGAIEVRGSGKDRVVIDTREYHTLNANSTNGQCFINFYVFKGDKKEYGRASVAEWVKWYAWKEGVLEGIPMPDTTPVKILPRQEAMINQIKTQQIMSEPEMDVYTGPAEPGMGEPDAPVTTPAKVE